MKKNLSSYILSLSLILVLLNCDKEEVFTKKTELKKEVEINYINSEEVENNILLKIQSKTGLKISNDYNDKFNHKNTSYQNSLDLNNIVQVIDTLGNINYTFKLNVEDNDDSTFYNLIVSEDSSKSEPIININKYIVNEEFKENFIASGYDFSEFSGKIYKYDIDNFKNAYGSFESKANVDDCPCQEIEVNNNSNGGSGGGSGGGTVFDVIISVTGSTTPVTCVSQFVVYECNGGGGHNGSDSSCTGSFIGSTVLRTTCSDGTVNNSDNIFGKTDDCNNPCNNNPVSGEVGILPHSGEIQSVESEPCEKLNSLLKDKRFRDAIDVLKEGIRDNLSYEIGYEFSKPENSLDINNPKYVVGGMTVPLRHGGDIIGGGHIHTDDIGQPMYSGDDIMKLYYYLIRNNNSATTSEVFSLLTTIKGTFAITINDKKMLGYILNKIGKDGLHNLLSRKYDNKFVTDNQQKYTGGLLKVFNEIEKKFNMPNHAINLFRLNNDGTAFEQLTLSENDIPKSNPCN